MITKDEIPNYTPAEVELPNGWTACVEVHDDDSMGAPWDEHDGHGPVSDWQPYEDIAQYQVSWVVSRCDGMCRVYDYAGAVKEALRDGWGCRHIRDMKDFSKARPGGHRSKQALAKCAVEQDFERMRAWCNDEWRWIGVVVKLTDSEGELVETGSLWGIESDTDYWREVAAELINEAAAGLVLPNAGSEQEQESTNA